jgi:hypothetical protein
MKIMRLKDSHYDWIPDLQGHRDFLRAAPVEGGGAIPASVDLCGQYPPAYDQGKLGNWMTNAIAAIGDHAEMGVDYDDAKQRFTVRNSWWPRWGMKGCFKLPYAYATTINLASDFWTIRLVT